MAFTDEQRKRAMTALVQQGFSPEQAWTAIQAKMGKKEPGFVDKMGSMLSSAESAIAAPREYTDALGNKTNNDSFGRDVAVGAIHSLTNIPMTIASLVDEEGSREAVDARRSAYDKLVSGGIGSTIGEVATLAAPAGLIKAPQFLTKAPGVVKKALGVLGGGAGGYASGYASQVGTGEDRQDKAEESAVEGALMPLGIGVGGKLLDNFSKLLPEESFQAFANKLGGDKLSRIDTLYDDLRSTIKSGVDRTTSGDAAAREMIDRARGVGRVDLGDKLPLSSYSKDAKQLLGVEPEEFESALSGNMSHSSFLNMQKRIQDALNSPGDLSDTTVKELSSIKGRMDDIYSNWGGGGEVGPVRPADRLKNYVSYVNAREAVTNANIGPNTPTGVLRRNNYSDASIDRLFDADAADNLVGVLANADPAAKEQARKILLAKMLRDGKVSAKPTGVRSVLFNDKEREYMDDMLTMAAKRPPPDSVGAIRSFGRALDALTGKAFQKSGAGILPYGRSELIKFNPLADALRAMVGTAALRSSEEREEN